MNVKGHLPVTLLDWEGKIATVLFLGGCNFRCAFCHNPELVLRPDQQPSVPFEDVIAYLAGKKGWIDGVVITGGEPTLSASLRPMIDEIRSLGYPVKLDTNGSNPAILSSLLDDGVIASVAMDIKGSINDYCAITGSDVAPETIRESIKLILRSGVEHEFRTTAYPPAVSLAQLPDIASELAEEGALKYVVQQFNPAKSLAPEASEVKPYRVQDLEDAVAVCNGFVPTKLR